MSPGRSSGVATRWGNRSASTRILSCRTTRPGRCENILSKPAVNCAACVLPMRQRKISAVHSLSPEVRRRNLMRQTTWCAMRVASRWSFRSPASSAIAARNSFLFFGSEDLQLLKSERSAPAPHNSRLRLVIQRAASANTIWASLRKTIGNCVRI